MHLSTEWDKIQRGISAATPEYFVIQSAVHDTETKVYETTIWNVLYRCETSSLISKEELTCFIVCTHKILLGWGVERGQGGQGFLFGWEADILIYLKQIGRGGSKLNSSGSGWGLQWALVNTVINHHVA